VYVTRTNEYASAGEKDKNRPMRCTNDSAASCLRRRLYGEHSTGYK